ncbi:uncharacterized protein LOC112453731 [Temnothorax curvispinosus]|uniref:Uncharacterized protein LOC112453731 n=1 Tax=Temnothorax curvispinosus TaxID=300111 RepID=A0A6J1PM46_9HYME|nr:uncharacterized protein LOC112453731 [Temnothorax curvispinosus]
MQSKAKMLPILSLRCGQFLPIMLKIHIGMSNDEESIPNTLVQAQENVILISDDAILQEVENSISFPFEELTDLNSDLPIYKIVMEDSTKEERKMIDSEYTRLVLDENRNNLEENDETIVSECIVNILHKENNNLRIHETNIEKESHSDGNNKIDENERASSTTHQQENAPLETSTEEENNLPNENQNKKYNMSQVALSSRGNVPIEKIWEKHLKGQFHQPQLA